MSVTVRVVTQSSVTVIVTSTLSEYSAEKRFQKDLTIAELKSRLELVTGASPSTAKLELYDKSDRLVARLDDDDSLLGSYPVDDGMRLHVVGLGPNVLESEGASAIEGFVLSEEEYSKRGDTVRTYLVRNKLGKYGDQAHSDDPVVRKELVEDDAVGAAGIAVGDRCEITLPGQPPKRGRVEYVGPTHFRPGPWVGVRYDEPLGKNDGSVDGKSYFECPPKYGAFVKPPWVQIGDFPEEDFGLDDDEM